LASIFTKIIRGDLPGRFVWRDDRAVAFLTINPIQVGHTLVVPIEEVDHWLDLEPALAAHLMEVSQSVGKAIQRAYSPVRVGMMIAGLEVPHVHLHVLQIRRLADLDFAKADPNPKPEDLDAAATKIRDALRALGYAQVSD
jgi:histidine triad (HIT) family protein